MVIIHVAGLLFLGWFIILFMINPFFKIKLAPGVHGTNVMRTDRLVPFDIFLVRTDCDRQPPLL